MAQTNRLAQEKSLYLLQHSENPVDWYPWGEEALEKARKEDKPILLSIGYSACHWCHVMAHESFEDANTAEMMNQHFVNIKLDREERPDIDKIYQTAFQLLNGQAGGWPLTVFLSPDTLVPFFIGTYFPDKGRYQLPAFKDILYRMSLVYRLQKADINKQNQSLLQILKNMEIDEEEQEEVILSEQPLQVARQQLNASFDSKHGGFGDSPKFPQTTYLELLLHYAIADADKDAWQKFEFTLKKMALGGMYDQVGGGFFRYSTDVSWEIPHFEKMLYDNGLLLAVYSYYYRVNPNPLCRHILEQTTAWVVNEMQKKGANYTASVDADSEKREGQFYIWTRKEIENLLTTEEFHLAENHYNLQATPNFEERWHLHVTKSIGEIANMQKTPEVEIQKAIASINQKLYVARKKRITPTHDQSLVIGWNALMVKGMLLASEVLESKEIFNSADSVLQYIRQRHWQQNCLYMKEDTKIPAFLDDYVFLLDALLTKLQVKWDTQDLYFAIALADNILKNFWDAEQGGFFFTSNDHEQMFYRPKPWTDEAVPASNAIAVRVLTYLGYLLGRKDYLSAAEQTLAAMWSLLQRYPIYHAGGLVALTEFLEVPEVWIVRGKDEDFEEWRKVFNKGYSLHQLCFFIPDDAISLPKALADKKTAQSIIAYHCKGFTCAEPITEVQKFKEQIGQQRISYAGR